VNYITVMEDDLYMFPRTDGILLGGLFQVGESSLSVDEPTKARVLKGHADFFGSFRRCPRVDLNDFPATTGFHNESGQLGYIARYL
jgi:hypothetical protein